MASCNQSTLSWRSWQGTVVHPSNPSTWETEAGLQAQNLTLLQRTGSCLRTKTKPTTSFCNAFLPAWIKYLCELGIWKSWPKDTLEKKQGAPLVAILWWQPFAVIPSSSATLKQRGIEVCAAVLLLLGCRGPHASCGAGIKLHHLRVVILNLVMLLCLLVLSHWALF